MEVIFFVVGALVVPVLINKSTEGESFNWLKPWLREAWTLIFVFFSAYFLLKPEARELFMRWHSTEPGLRGYLISGFVGALALCAYWYFTGIITPSKKLLEPSAPVLEPALKHHTTTPPTEDLSKPVLIFKDSPLFTAKTQTHIRREIAHFHKFLESLHVEISDEPSSVALDDKPKNNWRTQASINGEFYNNLVAIPKESLNDPKTITERYAYYVFWRLAQKENRWHPAPIKPFDPNSPGTFEWPVEQTESMFRMSLSFHVAEYLNQSYWNDPVHEPHDLCLNPPYSTFSPIPFYFWEIQRAFGKDFANRLAVYAVIAAEKHPLADDKPYYMGQLSYVQYVSNRLAFAETGVDNDGSKIESLQKIMNKCGDYWTAAAVKPKPH